MPNLDDARDAEAGIQLGALVKEGPRVRAVRRDPPPELLAGVAGAILAALKRLLQS